MFSLSVPGIFSTLSSFMLLLLVWILIGNSVVKATWFKSFPPLAQAASVLHFEGVD